MSDRLLGILIIDISTEVHGCIFPEVKFRQVFFVVLSFWQAYYLLVRYPSIHNLFKAYKKKMNNQIL
jgi:hypothetical protein